MLFLFDLKSNHPFSPLIDLAVPLNRPLANLDTLINFALVPDITFYQTNSIIAMAGLFNFSSSKSSSSDSEKQTLATDLNLVSPTTSKLAVWTTKCNQKDIQNDYKYFALNDEKTRAFNRRAISLPTQARRELFDRAPWRVGLHDDDLHISLGDLQLPQGTKRYSMTEAHEPIKNIKEARKTYREFYVFPPNDKKDPPPN